MFIEVTRVGKTGWVDIRVCNWAAMWTKRMPKGIAPLLDGRRKPHFIRKDWTHADILATVPK